MLGTQLLSISREFPSVDFVPSRKQEQSPVMKIGVYLFRTFIVGDVPEQTENVVNATKEALNAAIDVCRPGVDFREIGKAIELYTKKNHPKLVLGKDFIGHGVGKHFHASPWVFHFINDENEGVMKV